MRICFLHQLEQSELPEDSVYVLLVFPHAGLGTDSHTEPTLHEYLLSEYQ